MSYLNDIEDFSTDDLRKEIHRREEADREGRCWYCNKNLAAHSCKLAKPTPVPGWEVKPHRYVPPSEEGCDEYWMTDARNPVTGKVVLGQGSTGPESTAKCIENIRKVIHV